MDDDDNSVSSTASSVHEAIVSETDRRKKRLRRARERRRLHYQIKKGDSSVDDEEASLSLRSSTSYNSIMTVRTLEESLNGCTLAEMRKLRRKIHVKFKNSSNCQGKNPRNAGGNVVSDTSICSEQSAATSIDYSLGFREVSIREYELVPGCNPSISTGPPVELGWRHTKDIKHSVDAYELARCGTRRLQYQMRMPTEIREDLLLLHGSNLKEIRTAAKDAMQAKKLRLSTVKLILEKGEEYDEQREALKNAFTRPFRGRKKRQEERLLREMEIALQT